MSADTQTKPDLAVEQITQTSKSGKGVAGEAVDEGVKALKRTKDNVQQISEQNVAALSKSVAATVESSSVMTKLITDMSKNYMESCCSNMSNLSEFGRQAMACRTPAELFEVQKEAMEIFTASLTASNKVYSELFTSASKAWEPVIARASKMPSGLFGVLAD